MIKKNEIFLLISFVGYSQLITYFMQNDLIVFYSKQKHRKTSIFLVIDFLYRLL